MSDLKIYPNPDGTLTTLQTFQVQGERYFIINGGPYRVKKISRLHMKLRTLLHLKNPKNGVIYEVKNREYD
jgi:hypothetical protein